MPNTIFHTDQPPAMHPVPLIFDSRALDAPNPVRLGNLVHVSRRKRSADVHRLLSPYKEEFRRYLDFEQRRRDADAYALCAEEHQKAAHAADAAWNTSLQLKKKAEEKLEQYQIDLARSPNLNHDQREVISQKKTAVKKIIEKENKKLDYSRESALRCISDARYAEKKSNELYNIIFAENWFAAIVVSNEVLYLKNSRKVSVSEIENYFCNISDKECLPAHNQMGSILPQKFFE